MVKIVDILPLAQDQLAQLINDTSLSTRSKNVLNDLGLETVADLAQTTVLDIYRNKGIGKTSFTEICKVRADF